MVLMSLQLRDAKSWEFASIIVGVRYELPDAPSTIVPAKYPPVPPALIPRRITITGAATPAVITVNANPAPTPTPNNAHFKTLTSATVPITR